MKSKLLSMSIVVIVLTLLTAFGTRTDSFNTKLAEASAAPNIVSTQSFSTSPNVETSSGTRYFAKYDGIDGESMVEAYPKWIELMSIHWGGTMPTAGAGGGGGGRARLRPVLDDFELTFLYEKAEPKLEEKFLKGSVFPKLQVVLTQGASGGDLGPSLISYLKYEFKNAMITSFDISGEAKSGLHPTVTLTNSFEEVKVTYQEVKPDGSLGGSSEYTWKGP